MKSLSYATTIAALTALTTASPVFKPKRQWACANATCPGQLPGTILSPTLPALVSQQQPNQNFGASNSAVITPNDIGTIINFDIPAEAANRTCTLYFSFPDYTQLGGEPYLFSGPGNFEFLNFAYPAGPNTTYNTMPPIYLDLGIKNLQPGNFYNIASMPCPVGQISGVTFSNDTTFIYMQSLNSSCPIGLFTTYS